MTPGSCDVFFRGFVDIIIQVLYANRFHVSFLHLISLIVIVFQLQTYLLWQIPSGYWFIGYWDHQWLSFLRCHYFAISRFRLCVRLRDQIVFCVQVLLMPNMVVQLSFNKITIFWVFYSSYNCPLFWHYYFFLQLPWPNLCSCCCTEHMLQVFGRHVLPAC